MSAVRLASHVTHPRPTISVSAPARRRSRSPVPVIRSYADPALARHGVALVLGAAAGGLTARTLRQLNHQIETLRASDFGAAAGAVLGAAMLGNHAVAERLGSPAWALPAAVVFGGAYWTLTEGGRRAAIAAERVTVGGLGGAGAGLCVSLFETLMARGVPVALALPLAVALPGGILGSTL